MWKSNYNSLEIKCVKHKIVFRFFIFFDIWMKTKKPLAVRIFIRICVVAMVVSLVWVYVVYMFAPETPAENVEWTGNEVAVENEWEEVAEWEVVTEILPELDAENPEDTEAPILITEDWEVDEMDQMVEVQLENGETELVRLWDLTDAVQIN